MNIKYFAFVTKYTLLLENLFQKGVNKRGQMMNDMSYSSSSEPLLPSNDYPNSRKRSPQHIPLIQPQNGEFSPILYLEFQINTIFYPITS